MTTAPICQSCAMPITRPEDFGTNADSSQNEEFCVYCVEDGEYAAPDMTFEEMVGVVAGFMELPEDEAKAAASETLAGLKRWRGN